MADGDGDDDVIGRLPRAGDEEAPTPGLTPLEQLRAELNEIPVEFVELEVPERAGWAVRVNTTIRYDNLMAWRKQATEKSGAVNELKLAGYALANQCVALVRNGEDLAGEDTKAWTFRSPAFKELIGATDAVDAAIKLYGNDFHAINAANRLLFEAGYADGVGAVDDDDQGPTER